MKGTPPFHPRCARVLTQSVERLATQEEKKRGTGSPDLLIKSPAELQRRFCKEFPDVAYQVGKGLGRRNRPFAGDQV